MKYALLAFLILLSPVGADAQVAHDPGDGITNNPVKSEAVEIEEIDFEEVEEIEPVVAGTNAYGWSLFGVTKYRMLSISGPVIWTLLALAIATRWIKVKSRARLLLRRHKVFAYSAFCAGTVHGIVGLFF